jgi:hypothetical protein
LLLQAAKRKRIEEGYGKNKENAEEKEGQQERKEKVKPVKPVKRRKRPDLTWSNGPQTQAKPTSKSVKDTIKAQFKAQLPKPNPNWAPLLFTSPIRIGPPKYPKPTLYMHPPHPRTVPISSAVNVTVTNG